MKIATFKKISLRAIQGFFMILLCLGFTGCKEEIDESNFAIKQKMTAADYIDQAPELSMVKEVFQKVNLFDNKEASTIYSMLTTRGNYTMFLPTNEAMTELLQENGLSSIDDMDTLMLNTIAKNCIIDNENNSAYTTADFPIAGSFIKPNLSNRSLGSQLIDGATYRINGTSNVIKEDIEVSNGYIHCLDKVLNLSINTLDKLIGEADNMKIFDYLLKKTTWGDSIREVVDTDFKANDGTYIFDASHKYKWVEHRYLGHTGFIEPDSVYEKELGVKAEINPETNELLNGEEIIAKLQDFLKNDYGTDAATDFTSPENAINKFVAYHFIDGRITYNQLVSHYCEYGYKGGDPSNPQQVNLPVNVWAYYTSKGQYRSLLKITQVGDTGFEHDLSHTIYANRISTYANGPEEDYRETGVKPGFEGIVISPTNGENDNNSLNGFYYTLNKLLVYSKNFRNELGNERMRHSNISNLSEIWSNNMMGSPAHYALPKGYFKNITRESITTTLTFSFFDSFGYGEMRGAGIEAQGVYDVTVMLPPVPVDGTYEIRMNSGQNYIVRTMCQIYFGDNPDGLAPAGLPFDMRPAVGGDNFASIPWIDDTDDWTINYENDAMLRNQGYLKGPNYLVRSGKTLRRTGGQWGYVRRIITVADMKADKIYYLRFKTALKKRSRVPFDMIEIVPKSVYNGIEREDIW